MQNSIRWLTTTDGDRAARYVTTHLDARPFLLRKEYRLGDLLWFTAVLAAYRREVTPDLILAGCPDSPISHLLDATRSA